MSIDKLQARIRKLKNPSVIDFTVTKDQIPPHLFDAQENFVNAYGVFSRDVLNALKDMVPAVRFSYGFFSLFGPEGLTLLRELMDAAKSYGYYVLLDVFEFPLVQSSEFAAEVFSHLPADGYVCFQYSGVDAVKSYAAMCKNTEKSLFVNLRTPNKSASQLQDLMTGSRLVHMAATEIVSRLGEQQLGKSGFAQIAGVGAANAADSLRQLRSKHKNMFIMVDGYDYPNANAKNCSVAFDSLGHGAIVCAGCSVTAAWQEEDVDPRNYLESCVRAAEKMRKNILRYITIL